MLSKKKKKKKKKPMSQIPVRIALGIHIFGFESFQLFKYIPRKKLKKSAEKRQKKKSIALSVLGARKLRQTYFLWPYWILPFLCCLLS